MFIIDLHGFSEQELRGEQPRLYQHVYNHVRPERLTNNEKYRRENWWLFGRKNTEMREAISEISRYLVSVKTAKHRIFTFVENPTLPDSKLICIALSDAYQLSILSAMIHNTWTLNVGSKLEDRPTYVISSSFNKFPFPDLAKNNPLKSRIRELGEQLDAHRKRQQAAHPELTLTGMYNVLEKLRKAEPLNEKDKVIHDNGLVTLLKQIHDELDTAVLEAYGWQDLANATPLADRLAQGEDLSAEAKAKAEALEQEILKRLVALNHERAAEEAKGTIRWLRREYQDPEDKKGEERSVKSEQTELAGTETIQTSNSQLQTSATKQPWPETLPDQVAALRSLIPTTGTDADAIAPYFGKRTKKRLEDINQILTTLKNLGQL